MMSAGRERALDDLADAAASALAIVQRVGGSDGSVLAQIANHDRDGALSAKVASDLASLLRAMAERVRYTRAVAGESVEEPGVLRDSPAVVEMFDSSLPLDRKERFYTGTVLPMLIASDGFMHLNRFLRLCGAPTLPPAAGSLDGRQQFEFFTEYSFVESVFTEADKERFIERPTDNDTPDLVLVGDDWLLAVEAKMFHNPSIASLNEQLRRQQVIVDYLADVLGLGRERVRHVFLLPERLPAAGLNAPVITWEQVLSTYQLVGPRYWVGVLKAALDRFEDLVSRGPAFGQYKDSTLTGAEIRDRFDKGHLATPTWGASGVYTVPTWRTMLPIARGEPAATRYASTRSRRAIGFPSAADRA